MYGHLVDLIKNKQLRYGWFCYISGDRYYGFLASFTGTYIYSIYRAHKSENEVLRIGAAGSITTLIGESSFYFIDAINARSKVLSQNMSMATMMR